MLTLHSPAKINLFLRILHRRPDGYHELASLFQAIDLMDTLTFQLDEKDHLSCTNPSIPTDNSNLILKAANLFRKKTGQSFGLNVHLQKKIPHEAGLGGGSSNAATTLWAINQLLGTPIALKDLITWAAEIGSDVPFFLSQGTAYCTGRGEAVFSLPLLKKQPTWIIKPKQGISTPAVYKSLNLNKLPSRDPEKTLRDFYSGVPDYFNDLEQPALEIMPELQTIKDTLLSSGFKTVLLSGSGSSFFCIGNEQPPPITNCHSYQANWINRPLQSWYTDETE